MSETILSGTRFLLADGGIRAGSLTLIDGLIAAISPDRQPGLDAGHFLVLPGIVDLHGDAFERQLMPRPGVHFAPVANGAAGADAGCARERSAGIRCALTTRSRRANARTQRTTTALSCIIFEFLVGCD